jgi:hypothetical protein
MSAPQPLNIIIIEKEGKIKQVGKTGHGVVYSKI